jgi:hypothetical protein
VEKFEDEVESMYGLPNSEPSQQMMLLEEREKYEPNKAIDSDEE